MTRRTHLVTGATRGIGRALAGQLAAQGHHVIGLARNVDDRDFPGTLYGVDLADEAATARVLDTVCRAHTIDGVVNNVGFVRLARIGDIDLADLDTSLRLNLRPAVQIVQAVLPGMRERGWGRIVNMSSLVVLGMAERSVYAAAKSAMTSFTRTWALELARTGITVNGVAPGPTETALFRQNTPPGSDAERRFLAAVPMHRLGKPEEIAAAVAFLLSEDAAFMTGQTLFVDGGASIGRLPV